MPDRSIISERHTPGVGSIKDVAGFVETAGADRVDGLTIGRSMSLQLQAE